jgi:hypothetical protein
MPNEKVMHTPPDFLQFDTAVHRRDDFLRVREIILKNARIPTTEAESALDTLQYQIFSGRGIITVTESVPSSLD